MINVARLLPGNIYEAGVVNCARCGSMHSGVRFVPFNRPAEDTTHWAPCPKTGEPILFRVSTKPPAPPPVTCKAPRIHGEGWCGCPSEAA